MTDSTPRSRRSASMSDVAKRAGVSMATVSNALNQPDKLSQDTLRRVHLAIEELGFVRNRAARALAAGTSNTIGFVLADLANSFFTDMARGAEEEAQKHKQAVLMANSDVLVSKQKSYLTLFDEERVAGILLASIPGYLDGMDEVRAHGRPIVVLNDVAPDDVCSVVVNNEHGGYLAARHLIELGRRRLMFAGGYDQIAPLRDRHDGVRRAVAETNGAVTLEHFATAEVRVEHGHTAAAALLERSPETRPDGIVAAADLLAVGVMQGLAGSSIRIPEDIAIVGHDNNQSAWNSTIPLSTVSQPGHEVGEVAARLLLDEIRHPDRHKHRVVVLEPSLVVKESSVGRHP